jgi:stearoyl-CoA desaturase (delta-9 desaturase)
MGWLFESDPADIARSVPDMLEDPVVGFVDRTFHLWVFLGFALPAAVGYLVGGTFSAACSGLLWGGLVRMFLMHHSTFCVNSICHIFGTRPFESADHSANNAVVALISFGEGWHNNHHAFPTSARHGLRWYQFDLSWIFIRALQVVGLAWDVRVPTQAAMQAKRQAA